MFDADFFGSGFIEAMQAFSRDHRRDHGDHGDATLRVEVVTVTGERLDTMHFTAVATGARLSTRDDRMIFLPYSHIAFIDVSVLQDHRIAGFRLPTSSD